MNELTPAEQKFFDCLVNVLRLALVGFILVWLVVHIPFHF
jgi:hypothetical protein